MKNLLKSPGLGIAFLLPFVVMLAVHRLFNLSDAFLVAAEPGERPAYEFNLIMVGVFYLGIAAALHHLKASNRSPVWVRVKSALLVIATIVALTALY